jgi:hypothetical protein
VSCMLSRRPCTAKELVGRDDIDAAAGGDEGAAKGGAAAAAAAAAAEEEDRRARDSAVQATLFSLSKTLLARVELLPSPQEIFVALERACDSPKRQRSRETERKLRTLKALSMQR